jgi:hypothetical protein
MVLCRPQRKRFSRLFVRVLLLDHDENICHRRGRPANLITRLSVPRRLGSLLAGFPLNFPLDRGINTQNV